MSSLVILKLFIYFNQNPNIININILLTDSDVWDNKDVEDYNAIDYPYAYQPKQEAMSFLPLRLLRSPRGRIIDECCNKPCLLTELQSYCAV